MGSPSADCHCDVVYSRCSMTVLGRLDSTERSMVGWFGMAAPEGSAGFGLCSVGDSTGGMGVGTIGGLGTTTDVCAFARDVVRSVPASASPRAQAAVEAKEGRIIRTGAPRSDRGAMPCAQGRGR